MPLSTRLIRVGLPLLLIALCVFLWSHIVRDGVRLDALPGAVGPGGWPRAMIVGLAFFAILTLLVELNEWRLDIRRGSDAVRQADGEPQSLRASLLTVVGIGVIIAYGFAIPYAGFAFSTAAFIAIWCLLGNIRSPITVVLVSVIGTVVLLYMFVALAKMPLNRGIGPMNDATIALYRALRIY